MSSTSIIWIECIHCNAEFEWGWDADWAVCPNCGEPWSWGLDEKAD